MNVLVIFSLFQYGVGERPNMNKIHIVSKSKRFSGPSGLKTCCLNINSLTHHFDELKGAVGSADLKISKSALLSLNHHNFSKIKPIYTESSFMESLLNYIALEIKTKMVDLLPWRQQTTDS